MRRTSSSLVSSTAPRNPYPALLTTTSIPPKRSVVAVIAAVTAGAKADGQAVDCLLPAMVNLHSHAFQRAMAGMTEYRSAGQDSFWTWRTLMYRFLDRLTPEDVQAIAAMVMLEMAEAGYAAVAEFHYLHHAPGGGAYDDLAEMSARIAAALSLLTASATVPTPPLRA